MAASVFDPDACLGLLETETQGTLLSQASSDVEVTAAHALLKYVLRVQSQSSSEVPVSGQAQQVLCRCSWSCDYARRSFLCEAFGHSETLISVKAVWLKFMDLCGRSGQVPLQEASRTTPSKKMSSCWCRAQPCLSRSLPADSGRRSLLGQRSRTRL